MIKNNNFLNIQKICFATLVGTLVLFASCAKQEQETEDIKESRQKDSFEKLRKNDFMQRMQKWQKK